MPPTAAPNSSRATRTARPIQDEWGVYDPNQAGMPAALRALNDAVAHVPDAAPVELAAPAASVAPPQESPDGAALYSVESPLRCPQCQRAIRTFRALRVVRTHVAFMSTLPRKGYVLVCPECGGLLSAELSGLL
jgi:hypothetical protein